jgi:hypothetical protein
MYNTFVYAQEVYVSWVYGFTNEEMEPLVMNNHLFH